MEHSQLFLVTVLIANNIVNISASIIAATLTYQVMAFYQLEPWIIFTAEIIVLTMVFLIVAETTPKVIAANRSLEFARLASPFIRILMIVLWPISKLMYIFTKIIKIKLRQQDSISNEDFKTIADVVHEHGSIEDSEREIINSLSVFGDLIVKDIMVSRLDIVGVEVGNSFEETLKMVQDNGHSRIPLFTESLDNIVGIIYAKDLIPFLMDKSKRKNFNLEQIARQPLFIPEGKKLTDLLKEFQSQKMHIGIVVDEYGGTSGLVTMEDVIEQIVGDINDEHDEEDHLVKILAPNVFLFDGKIEIEEAEKYLQIQLLENDDEFETLAGCILSLLGTIPKEKSVINKGNVQFIIEEMDARRISKIKAIRHETTA